MNGSSGNNCSDRDSCSNPDCQREIARQHYITKDELEAMVNDFFGSDPIPEPLVMPASDLAAMLDVDCRENRVDFTIPENTSTQQDITVEVKPGYEPPVYGMSYSIAHFKGVLLDDPDEVHFYKARNTAGETTLVFQSMKGGGTISCYNRTSSWP
jgi:hypothetical protein